MCSSQRYHQIPSWAFEEEMRNWYRTQGTGQPPRINNGSCQHLCSLSWFRAHRHLHPHSPVSQLTWVWPRWTTFGQFNWTKFGLLLHNHKCQTCTGWPTAPMQPNTNSPQHFCQVPEHTIWCLGQYFCFYTNSMPVLRKDSTQSAVELEHFRQFLKHYVLLHSII